MIHLIIPANGMSFIQSALFEIGIM